MSPSAGGFSETPGAGLLLRAGAQAQQRRTESLRLWGCLGRGNSEDPQNLGNTAPVPMPSPPQEEF